MICALIRWYRNIMESITDDDYLMTRIEGEYER